MLNRGYPLAGTSPRRCRAASRAMVLIGSAQKLLRHLVLSLAESKAPGISRLVFNDNQTVSICTHSATREVALRPA